MSSTPKIPPWLSASITPKHLRRVVAVLRERESKREAARSASRKADVAPQPTTHSSQFIASLRHPKPGRDVDEHYTILTGCQVEHQPKNRYLDLEPYDRTRVLVGEEGRYLHASWVLERFGHKWWIAAQAPLPYTSHAFLSVILQPSTRPPDHLQGGGSPNPHSRWGRVRTVVQLTQNVESGRRKAHAYFPDDVGKSMIIPVEHGSQAPALKVTLIESRVFEEAHCIQSTVAIVPVAHPPSGVSAGSFEEMEVDEGVDEERYGEHNEERIVFRHLLYTSWPDHGVPETEDRASLLAFLRLVDETNRDTSLVGQLPDVDPDPPIIVGCSAGIGRTGSFIAISSLLRSLNLLPPPASPSPSTVLPTSPLGSLPPELAEDCVAQEVDSLREQRPGMVQRDAQITLIYQTVIDALEVWG
ncbi:uncharacterized protein LACBIDRAFT_320947 [Laccaria bicolor S238N-H82]|uniref:Predicted protein n=1 Tax=Laccaria bicolor (strain S238N-H82 / ATCC MYA-4686) TaxID=486041 RepID=B0CN95_LACBS|nr:uncharacterized protein LACBIDRAFT_320947 [Laccaria bicolor S238N-H82]EDR15264.1 predicted protein [Laccaria bicolor S238N-H82]|eukprot:XP_001873472.1 predicted protein [Laccaria bicolor S238N-H82]